MAPRGFTSTSLLSAALLAPALVASSCIRQCLESKQVPSFFCDDAEWTDLITPYNLRLNYTPAAVVAADNVHHVSDAVKCANECPGTKIQPKSGGHSYASYSSGGQNGSLIIDLASLNQVTVEADGTAYIDGGLRLGNVDVQLYDQGKRAMSHGTCANVGIGGHSTHGGYGYDSRIWGLALDHILDIEVVLADGSISVVSQDNNEDVYWALRGAADSIGIATKFHVRTQEAPESLIYWTYNLADILVDVPTAVKAVQHIQDFALNETIQDRRLTWGWQLTKTAFNLRGKFFGSLEEYKSRIEPEMLRGLPAPTTSDVREVDWLISQTLYNDGSTNLTTLNQPDEPGTYHGHDNFYAKSITIPDRLTEEAIADYFTYALEQGAAIQDPSSWFSIFNLYGGPDSQINIYDAEWSSYKDRDSLWVVQNYAFVQAGFPYNEGLTPFLDGMNDAITEKMPDTAFGAYHNYIDPDLTPAEAHELYYGPEIYPRLLDIKKRVDPDFIFYNPLAIGVGDESPGYGQ